jgi:hypothetical protein
MNARKVLPLCAALLALASCATKTPPRTATMQEMGVSETTAAVRLYLHEYLRFYTDELETMTDRILVAEKDLAIREAVLRLRVHAVPSMQAVVFQRAPLAALLDAWALTAAIRRFLEVGNGREAFGGSQAIAVATFRGLEDEVAGLMDRIVGPERRRAVTAEFEPWFREHSIEDFTLGLSPKDFDATERTASLLGSGGLQSVANLDETARDLSDRLTIYAELTPGEARRQGELLLVEAGGLCFPSRSTM